METHKKSSNKYLEKVRFWEQTGGAMKACWGRGKGFYLPSLHPSPRCCPYISTQCGTHMHREMRSHPAPLPTLTLSWPTKPRTPRSPPPPHPPPGGLPQECRAARVRDRARQEAAGRRASQEPTLACSWKTSLAGSRKGRKNQPLACIRTDSHTHFLLPLSGIVNSR